MDQITAIDIAKHYGLDPKRLRQALRDENFDWHPVKYARWIVQKNSAEEADIVRIAERLVRP